MADATVLREYRVAVPDADLGDLRDRLARTRWPEAAPDDGWEYGVPVAYLRDLAEYWRATYDWRAHEARLNALPQFTTTIDGANVHFVHARSPEPDALPLILTHGWPGSIAEFLDLIGPLSNPRAHDGDPADAFHVICPSVPGFAFSGPTRDRGWHAVRIAEAFSVLMERLGYHRYGAQGGDFGSGITRMLALRHPERLAGIHLNLVNPGRPAKPSDLEGLSDVERERLGDQERYDRDLSGYWKVQSTRPQTLAYGLTDSPVGQLAWIVEKFKDWTDSRSVPDDAVDRDAILTDVSIYWFTRTAASSARLYYENYHRPEGRNLAGRVEVPTGVAIFPREIFRGIRRFAERDNNIVRWSEFDRGGHFAALEEPDLLLADVRAFFRDLR